jgi:hypothetical protein
MYALAGTRALTASFAAGSPAVGPSAVGSIALTMPSSGIAASGFCHTPQEVRRLQMSWRRSWSAGAGPGASSLTGEKVR